MKKGKNKKRVKVKHRLKVIPILIFLLIISIISIVIFFIMNFKIQNIFIHNNANLSDEYMMSVLMDHGTFSKEKLQMFLDSPNPKQMMIDMKNTSMGKKWFSRGLDVIDKVPMNMRYDWCRHNIRFSVSPPIVLISYIFLKEIEIYNIINVIEGVKYRLSPEQIKAMLIGVS